MISKQCSNAILNMMAKIDTPALTLAANLNITNYNIAAEQLLSSALKTKNFKELCKNLDIPLPPIPLDSSQDTVFMTDKPVYIQNKQYLKFIITKYSVDHNNDAYLVMIHEQPNIDEYIANKKIRRNLANMDREVTGLNVDDNKPIEEYVYDMRNYLEKIIAIVPANIYWMDKNCITLGCNDNAAKLLGLKSRKDIAGMSFYDMAKIGHWDKKQADSFYNNSMQVIKTGKPLLDVEESPVPNAEGELIYYLSNRVPIKDNSGNIIGLVGISFDITKRKQEQQELQELHLREKLLEEKLEAMNAVAGSIAHELRTPLAAISKGTSIKKFMPRLIEAYKLALEAKLPVTPIRNNLIKNIEQSLDRIKEEAYSANEIINLLLANLQKIDYTNNKLPVCPISECIKTALTRYPFNINEEEKITTDVANNFKIRGEIILVEHIIFNLLKNAFYYITKAGKGSIHIWLEKKQKHNELHFKDTGTGIASDILPHIFEHFYSKTPNGTGMGLAFCKMAMDKMGGTITCRSKTGSFTEFILSFPKINK